jgi:hypothetical protein
MALPQISRWIKRVAWFIVSTLVLGGVVLVTGPLWMSHRVSFSAEKRGEVVVFKIDRHNVNGIWHVRVVDKAANQVLWSVDLPYYPGPVIYGQVPGEYISVSGHRNRGKQVFPEGDQTPVPIPTNKEIIVHVHYQYDTWHPAASSRDFSMVVSPDGRIRTWETQ